MAMNNRGLGRGIQALFENGPQTLASDGGAPSPLKIAPIEAVIPNPGQPRKRFDEAGLRDLSESIRAHGVLQPLLVRPSEKAGEWLLVAGERRLRAARMAGLKEIPILERPLTDTEAMIVALLENLQREDLNPIEEAQGLEALKNAMNVSLEELAQTIGQARSTISNSLRLLALDPAIQDSLANGQIGVGHAKILAGMASNEAALRLHNRILAKGLTTRQTDEAAAFWSGHGRFPWEEAGGASPEKSAAQRMSAEAFKRLGYDIGAALNCRAKISGSGEKGRISLAYDSSEELARLLGRLGLKLPE